MSEEQNDRALQQMTQILKADTRVSTEWRAGELLPSGA